MKFKCRKAISLFLTGGIGYVFIEILFRGYSHWTMFLLGGACFVLCGSINEYFTWTMPMWMQQAICAIIITVLEFIVGCIVNLWCGLNVWDYSNLPLNLLGQVSLTFSIVWFFISGFAIILDDYIRWIFFQEEKPRYIWW